MLNYRLVGFSFPDLHHSSTYKIEIAKGTFTKEGAFSKNIIKSITSKSNKVIIDVPAFGELYTWRVVYKGNKKSPFYHFGTKTNLRVDTSKIRLRIMQHTDQYKDMYVSVDGGGVLYDMEGNAVWYLPDTNGLGGYVVDLNFTAQHTITFLYVRGAYEVNLNGDILWKAPSHDTIHGVPQEIIYHHEMTRLPNGHYMVMAMDVVMSKVITQGDSSYIVLSRAAAEPKDYQHGRYSTLIEYDENGNIVWSWKDADHLVGSDFDYFTSPVDPNLRFDPHANSFFFDEKTNVIYLGYRNLNRITKISYPSGKILATYGDVFKPGMHAVGEGLFCNQHGLRTSSEGYLYYFNNNSCRNTDSIPSLVILQEPSQGSQGLKKIWDYTCKVEPNSPKRFGAGGDVIEMPDGNLFACAGSEYSKIFIVTRQKKELWSAMPERYIETENRWVCNRQYRANFINRKDLEDLIWNAESYEP